MGDFLSNMLSNAGLAAKMTLNPIGTAADLLAQSDQPATTGPATRAQAAAQAYRKGLMAPQVAQAYEQAVQRGIVKDPYASARMNYRGQEFGGHAPGPAPRTSAVLPAAVNGAMWGHGPSALGVLYGAQTGVGDALDSLTGKHSSYGPLDALSAAKDEENAQLSANFKTHPVTSIASTIGGGLLAPGAAQAGSFVRGGVGSARTAQAARGAVLGGLTGAAAGADNAPKGQKLKAALQSGALGAGVGAAAPVITGVAADALGALGQQGARLAARVTGNTSIDPQRQAAMALAKALKTDGATPEQMNAILNEWLRVGGPSPTLIDLAAQLPNKGQATLGLMRAAALSSPTARGVATAHSDQVAADLQDNAIARTRALTPDTRPVSVVDASVRGARSANAAADYAVPSAAPVDAAPVIEAMGGRAGANAIGSAVKSADIARNPAALAELSKINGALNAPDTASVGGDQIGLSPAAKAAVQRALGQDPNSQQVPVSVGTLNAIKQALFRAGRGAASNPETAGDAPGYFQRATEIDNHLAANNPDYANANANYAAASGRLDALGHGGSILNASPDEFASQLDAIIQRAQDARHLPNIPDGRSLAQVGARQAITDAIGAPTQGSTGALNRVGTATNTGQNLSKVFGEEPAADYRQSIGNMVQQLKTARAIDPNQNARTAMNATDLENYGLAPKTGPVIKPLNLITTLVAKVRAGLALTDEERQALVQLGVGRWDPGAMQAAIAQPPPSQGISGNALVPALTYGQRDQSRP